MASPSKNIWKFTFSTLAILCLLVACAPVVSQVEPAMTPSEPATETSASTPEKEQTALRSETPEVATLPPVPDTEVPEVETMDVPIETEETGETPAVTEMPLPVDPSGQTVVFWHVWGSGSAAEGLEEIVREFNASNEWGINVEAVDQGSQGDLNGAIEDAIFSGNLPNVSPGFPSALANWHLYGVIADLNPFIRDPAFGLTPDEFGAIFESIYQSGTFHDGTQIGIPMHQSAYVIFYNVSWAKELGFGSPPATTVEFKEQACKGTEFNAQDDDPSNDGTGGYVLFPGASNILSWVYAFGGDIVDDTGESYTLNTRIVKDVALFLKDLKDSGCTFETDNFPNPEMASRKALLTTSSTAGIPFQKAAFREARNTDEWALIPFMGPDGTKAVNAFGQLIGILDTSPETNLASWIWLKHFTSPEIQAKWIRFSAYFPSQVSVTPLLEDYVSQNPIYGLGLDTLTFGKSEPNIPAHSEVRSKITRAFFLIMDASNEAEIDAILEDLQITADELVAEFR